jgi:hypothetical protein
VFSEENAMLHPDPFLNIMSWIGIWAVSILILMSLNDKRIAKRFPKWLVKIGYGYFIITVSLFFLVMVLALLISLIAPLLQGNFTFVIEATMYIGALVIAQGLGWFIVEIVLRGKVHIGLNPIMEYVTFGLIALIILLALFMPLLEKLCSPCFSFIHK